MTSIAVGGYLLTALLYPERF
ncbi:potassium-transporting ATPase subunit F [Marinobacter sp. CA1]|nr:potassium-transporting ATPase subunit F [Marinobacter sp. CA1]